MNDAPLSAASSAVLAGGASAALAAGWPPQDVIFWAAMGGLASVWLSRKTDTPVTIGWAIGSLAHLCIATAAGIALSAIALALAPAYSWLAPLAAVPRWALAVTIAALSYKAGPLAWGRIKTLFGLKEQEGSPNA